MNIETAKAKLKRARLRAKKTREEIDALLKFIREAGGDPDKSDDPIVNRNREMYKRWKDGLTFQEIAREFKTSVATVRNTCRRIELILERRISDYKLYDDLLIYKPKTRE